MVGYSGNLGRAHEFNTLLAASQRLKDHPCIVFACVGGGYGFDELRRKVAQHGLNRIFQFFPYQDRSMLKYSLGAADVHWISLKPQLEELIVPSKFYGVAAAGRPVITISAENGEIAQLIHQHRCGIVVKPGDAETLAQAILSLAAIGNVSPIWAAGRETCWSCIFHAGTRSKVGGRFWKSSQRNRRDCTGSAAKTRSFGPSTAQNGNLQAIRNGVYRVGLGDTSSDLRPPRIMTGVVAAFRLAAAAPPWLHRLVFAIPLLPP